METLDFQALGPAFTAYVRPFLDCCPHKNTRTHFTTYCLGLLRGDGRKSVEPIALAGGPAVRTLQVFLASRPWDKGQALATLQRRLKANGHAFDWLIFDEGYGGKPKFLTLLSLTGHPRRRSPTSSASPADAGPSRRTSNWPRATAAWTSTRCGVGTAGTGK